MKKKKLPRSLKKHIRKEKARLCREVLNIEERRKLIDKLYKKSIKDKINHNED